MRHSIPFHRKENATTLLLVRNSGFMRSINIAATSSTPAVMFSQATGQMHFSGFSFHENPFVFYKPLFEWVDEYILQPHLQTTLSISFRYLNSSSSKCIFAICKKLKVFSGKRKHVTINWQYKKGDEDMLQKGHEFSEMLEMPFDFIEGK